MAAHQTGRLSGFLTRRHHSASCAWRTLVSSFGNTIAEVVDMSCVTGAREIDRGARECAILAVSMETRSVDQFILLHESILH